MSAAQKSGALMACCYALPMMAISMIAAVISASLAYAQPITVPLPPEPRNVTEGIHTTNELVASYSDVSEFQRRSSPVGLFETRWAGPPGADILTTPCTAWLIDRNRILTNYHCYQPSLMAQGLPNYRRDRSTFRPGFLGTGEGGSYTATFISGNPELDYAIFELNDDANPGDTYGIIRIAAGFQSSADRLPTLIVHHPLGMHLMIAKDGTCHAQRYSLTDRSISHMCDTRLGSSGSPLLIYSWALNRTGNADQVPYREMPIAIGLHYFGFDDQAPTSNHPNLAINMNLIIEDNEYLQSIACRWRENNVFDCPEVAHGQSQTQLRQDAIEIVIPATSFTNSSHVIPALDENAVLYGDGIVLSASPGRQVLNIAEYQVRIEQAGHYWLYVEYASASPRPVYINISRPNGVARMTNKIASSTGCWEVRCQTWERQGMVELSTGLVTISLGRRNDFPHIRTIRLVAIE